MKEKNKAGTPDMTTKTEAFGRLLNIMDDLRKGCPWDREQTFESLRHLTIEEVYELSDAILEKDMDGIKKELGDLMLHLVFYAKIGSEQNAFNIKDVLDGIAEKLIHRHPHIYGGIESPLLNPFTSNQTNQTEAGSVIYEISLHLNPLDLETVDGSNPYSAEIFPNPTKGTFSIQLNKSPERSCYYFISDVKGSILLEGQLELNRNRYEMNLPNQLANQVLFLTLNIDNQYYVDQQIVLEK